MIYTLPTPLVLTLPIRGVKKTVFLVLLLFSLLVSPPLNTFLHPPPVSMPQYVKIFNIFLQTKKLGQNYSNNEYYILDFYLTPLPEKPKRHPDFHTYPTHIGRKENKYRIIHENVQINLPFDGGGLILSRFSKNRIY